MNSDKNAHGTKYLVIENKCNLGTLVLHVMQQINYHLQRKGINSFAVRNRELNDLNKIRLQMHTVRVHANPTRSC